MVWLFFLGTALSVFVLRRKEPHLARPYKVIGYPITPVIFSACCIFMLYSSVSYALANTPHALLILLGVLLVGGIIYRSTDTLSRGGGVGISRTHD